MRSLLTRGGFPIWLLPLFEPSRVNPLIDLLGVGFGDYAFEEDC
jgi:hypothetical protein